MIDPRHLAFDVDGVIANTMKLFIDIAREVYDIHHIRYEQITAYDLNQTLDLDPEMIQTIADRITEGDYPCELAPMPGAADVLKRLGALGPIQMVTARPHLGPIQQWMADLVGTSNGGLQILATGRFDAKPDILQSRCITHFVEDRLETCYLLCERQITPILFVQPWNRQNHPFLEVDGWQELDALIQWPATGTSRATG